MLDAGKKNEKKKKYTDFVILSLIIQIILSKEYSNYAEMIIHLFPNFILKKPKKLDYFY
jgi:hypothetical protein